MVELIVNFDNPAERAMLLDKARNLQGAWRVKFVRHRARRSDRQLRYYWPCFIQPFADHLRENGQQCSDEMVHEAFKLTYNPKTIVNPDNGEVMYTVGGSTGELSTVEFNAYLDAIAFDLSKIGIIVPEPSVYHEKLTSRDTDSPAESADPNKEPAGTKGVLHGAQR